MLRTQQRSTAYIKSQLHVFQDEFDFHLTLLIFTEKTKTNNDKKSLPVRVYSRQFN